MQGFFKCKPTVKTVGLQTERYVQFNEYAQPFKLIEPFEPQLLKPHKPLKLQKPLVRVENRQPHKPLKLQKPLVRVEYHQPH